LELKAEYFGNSLYDWLIAFGIALAINVAIRLVKRLVERKLDLIARQTDTLWDDAFVAVIKKTKHALLFLVIIYISSRWLELPANGSDFLKHAATVGLFIQIGIWINALFSFVFAQTTSATAAEGSAQPANLSALGFVAKGSIWAAVLLLTLANLGVDVTALVAGLGVGGIAIALAVQNILGDLLASLSIVMDKPFVVGDFVVVDDYMGTIEHIGIKTTRLRSLSGEQVVFSNNDLLKSRLRNYKRMRERRAIFNFGVLYQTPHETLERMPKLIQSIIESQKKTRFDRAHFKGFGDSSLDFEVVYWVLDPDFNQYMDVQQAINLALIKAMKAASVGFAFPSHSLYLESPLRIERMATPPDLAPVKLRASN
jgi:small-conductance mechanosensitive channel